MKRAASSPFRLAITTESERVELWEKARALNPKAMAWARQIKKRRTPDGSLEVTVEISRSRYEYTATGVGPEYVEAAIEEALTMDANEIVLPHDDAQTVLALPCHVHGNGYGPHTFIVQWTTQTVCDVRDAIEETGGVLKSIRMVRLSDIEDGKVWLAVSMPCEVLSAVIERHRTCRSDDIGACFDDPHRLADDLEHVILYGWMSEGPEPTLAPAPLGDDYIPF